jgi:transmembrane sensor
MSNVSKFTSRQDTCVDEAGEWIAKMGNGLTEQEEIELGRWLSQSEGNYKVFMELAELWDDMDSLSRLADMFPEPTLRRAQATSGPKWLVAATVLVGIVVFTLIVATEKLAPEPQMEITAESSFDYETAIGEQSAYALSDGTEIVLNTDSYVKVQYTNSNRLLTLVRGEVHIKVAHDSDRPLSVMVGDKVVQAVGTEFNLEITSDQSIELVVSEGVVIVGVLDSSTESRPAESPLVLIPSSTLVAAGQELSIEAHEQAMDVAEATPIEGDEIAIKLSWRDGNLIFRGESLEEAVAEVGRYTAVEFVFLDEQSKKVRVAGLFKAGDVEGLLTALRIHFNIAYEWQGDDKILLSAEK